MKLKLAALVLILGWMRAEAATLYVSPSGSNIPPFADWSTAASEIQSAINLAVNGDTVLVSNGVYASGGKVAIGVTLTNRVMIPNGIAVRSVNGPSATTIVGVGPRGPSAVRGAYLNGSAKLIGFTITNGHTQTSGDWRFQEGGGVLCDAGGEVSNCVLTGNAALQGGGFSCAYGGIIRNSTIVANRADNNGGGVRFTDAITGLVENCRILRNLSATSGGGAHIYHSGRINNSLIADNVASNDSGGVYVDWGLNYPGSPGAHIDNCTIAGNQAPANAGFHYVINGGYVRNSIIYGNSSGNWNGGTYEYCDTTPLPPGAGNITANPTFTDSAYHVAPTSVVINAGTNSFAPGTADLDGNARIQDGTVDMGAYERGPAASLIVISGVPADVTVECAQVPAPAPVTASSDCAGRGNPPAGMNPVLNPANGHYYQFVTNTASWGQASNQARVVFNGATGHLATITSQQENDFLTAFIPASGYSVRIGGTDLGSEGTWRWITGEPWVYTNWRQLAPAAPNGGASENSLLLMGGFSGPELVGRWEDSQEAAVPDPVHGYYIVEWDNVPAGSGPVDVVFSDTSEGTCPQTIHRTWTATDGCGNIASATQRITVVDTTAPVLVSVPANETNECGSVSAPAVVTATDDCGSDSVDSPPGMNPVLNPANGHYYQFVTNTASWAQASNDARVVFGGVTGHLATITSQEENDFLTAFIPSDGYSVRIGGTDLGSEGTWRWITGEPWVYANWRQLAPAAPNGGASENSLLLMGGFSGPELVGRWEDSQEAAVLDPVHGYYIVEWDNVPGGNVNVDVLFSETATGSCPRTIKRIWTATDACGNTVGATQTITVVDTTAPILAGVPADVTVECGEAIPAPAEVTAADECSGGGPVSPDGLVLYMPFDVSEADTVTDQSGHGNHGTRQGATFTTNGHAGGAYAFDGNDRILLADMPYVEGQGALSFGAWIKPTGIHLGGIIGKTMDNDDNVLLNIDTRTSSQTNTSVGVGTTPINIGGVLVFGPPAQGQWQHVMGVFDGTNTKLYHNGVLMGATPDGPAPQVSRSNNVVGAIGDSSSTRGWYFQGLIDDVRVYQRALSASEVAGLYSAVGPPTVQFAESSSGDDCPRAITRTWTATDACGNATSATQVITVLAASDKDSDGDGLLDIYETNTGIYKSPFDTGTDPNKFDTDGDKQGDGQEVKQGTNPNDPKSFAHIIERDFDGDGITDIVVIWPQQSLWYIQLSSTGRTTVQQQFGWFETKPVSGDFDGDGKADIAVYHPASGRWYIRQSSNNVLRVERWGWSEALPVPEDYDGDRRTDVAVYHPASGNWYIQQSTTGKLRLQQWGWSAAQPAPGDYDGDGKADIAVYHPATGNWYILESSTGKVRIQQWGWSAAEPVAADFDGDFLFDIAVYNAASGNWYIRESATGKLRRQNWGWSAAEPVPGDYDGDHKADVNVFWPGGGMWYIQQSGSGNSLRKQPWGWSATIPLE